MADLSKAVATGLNIMNDATTSPTNTSSISNALSGLINTPSAFIFPLDLISDNRSYYMTIRFATYSRPSIFQAVQIQPTDEIRLPIPNNLVDSQTIVYTEESLPAAAGAAIESAAGAGGQITQGILDAAKGAAAGVVNSLGNQVTQGISSLVPGGNIELNNILQLTGKATNPFLTVMFKQPTFKPHTFSWKFMPKNADESAQLKGIITTMRRHMLPSKSSSGGGTLLNYPDIALINLYPDDYLYKFQPCVIENMSVNYAPGATPSFFRNTKAPTEIMVTLQLKEIIYQLQDNYVG